MSARRPGRNARNRRLTEAELEEAVNNFDNDSSSDESTQSELCDFSASSEDDPDYSADSDESYTEIDTDDSVSEDDSPTRNTSPVFGPSTTAAPVPGTSTTASPVPGTSTTVPRGRKKQRQIKNAPPATTGDDVSTLLVDKSN